LRLKSDCRNLYGGGELAICPRVTTAIDAAAECVETNQQCVCVVTHSRSGYATLFKGLRSPGGTGRALVGEPLARQRAPSSAVGLGSQVDLIRKNLSRDNVGLEGDCFVTRRL
jgi:hypothetical protein